MTSTCCSAWVLDNDSVVCKRHANGDWQPVQVGLPMPLCSYHRASYRAPTDAPHLTWPDTAQPAVPLTCNNNINQHRPTQCCPDHALSLASAQSHGLLGDNIAHLTTDDRLNTSGLALLSYRYFIGQANITMCQRLAQAIQLLRWQDTHRYCGSCGALTQASTAPECVKLCSHCGQHHYPRVQPCVITAITRTQQGRQQILLAHHHRYSKPALASTHGPRYGLIAGFVEVAESLEQAVRREILEEVGLEVTNLCYHSSQPWPYPSNVMVGFVAQYASGDIQVQQSELSHAQFFDLDDLPNIPAQGSIAYDLIAHILKQAGRPAPTSLPFTDR